MAVTEDVGALSRSSVEPRLVARDDRLNALAEALCFQVGMKPHAVGYNAATRAASDT